MTRVEFERSAEAIARVVLDLVAPEHRYRQTVTPESPGCAFAAWLDRRPR